MVNYQEYDPSPDLKEIINCFWTVWFDPSKKWNFERPLLPDGSVDILFNLSGYAQYKNMAGITAQKKSGIILGTQTKPCWLKPTRNIHCLAIRFCPGYAYQFLGIPLDEFTDHFVSLEEAMGNMAKDIENRLLNFSPNLSSQIHFLEEEIRQRVFNKKLESEWIRATVQLVKKNKGQISIQALSKKIGFTRQYLARLFKCYTGIGLKMFSKVVRFQEVMKKLEENEFSGWCSLALEAGYYDQSHLIADFIEFTGINPTDYVSRGFHKFQYSNIISFDSSYSAS